MVNSIPGLYLLGTSSTIPNINQKCLQALPNVGGEGQGQNHCPLRTSELKKDYEKLIVGKKNLTAVITRVVVCYAIQIILTH